MNKILIIASFISLNAMSSETANSTFGRIVDLKGSGFISFQGKTREIKKGDSIEVGAEIVIEHKGQVSFTDNADHRFHLGNASSAALSAHSLELRSGDLWFQSLNKNDDYSVKTVNAMVNYQGGEGILSYDSNKGKTQLMVINGMMKLANLSQPELNLSVAEGHFSFVDNSYDEGAPRDPTPVGEKTYGQLVGLFNAIAPMDKNSSAIFKDHDKHETHEESPKKTETAMRAIASVETENSKSKSPSIDPKFLEDYQKSILNKSVTKKAVTSKKAASKMNKVAKVKDISGKLDFHIYGQSASTISMSVATTTEKTPEIKTRAPASVLEQDVPVDSLKLNEANQVAPDLSHEVAPYNKDYKIQNKESDKLIEELKKL